MLTLILNQYGSMDNIISLPKGPYRCMVTPPGPWTFRPVIRLYLTLYFIAKDLNLGEKVVERFELFQRFLALYTYIFCGFGR